MALVVEYLAQCRARGIESAVRDLPGRHPRRLLLRRRLSLWSCVRFVAAVEVPWSLFGEAALADARKRARGCSRPVRLVGSTAKLNRATGEVVSVYSSAHELDGITVVRCGDRGAARCESCCREYNGDAWHLLAAGLIGGKGAPESVGAHPSTFVTMTAPSFGPVHGRRRGAPTPSGHIGHMWRVSWSEGPMCPAVVQPFGR